MSFNIPFKCTNDLEGSFRGNNQIYRTLIARRPYTEPIISDTDTDNDNEKLIQFWFHLADEVCLLLNNIMAYIQFKSQQLLGFHDSSNTKQDQLLDMFVNRFINVTDATVKYVATMKTYLDFSNNLFQERSGSDKPTVGVGDSAYFRNFQSFYKNISCTSPSVQNKQLKPIFVIGGEGEHADKLSKPWGVAVDKDGRILISDRNNHNIQVYDESGKFVFEFGSEGSRPGEFFRPTGIAVDLNNRIVVADKDNHRIQVFTSNGRFIFTFGSLGIKHGEFQYPWDVAVNSNCDIAVSDTKNQRIQFFNQKGQFLTKFLTPNKSGKFTLNCPRGLTFWPNGSLLVTDFNSHRVIMINKILKAVFGKEGNEPKMFFRPQGITCDMKRRFAVADCKNHRIQIFDSQGNLCSIFGEKGTKPGQFDCPQGICFHPNGKLIVVDMGNKRVQVF